MNQKIDYHYDDDKLSGLDIAGLILNEWRTGRYHTIAEVTSAVHSLQSELPRSVIFWLAYHTLGDYASSRMQQASVTPSWPLR